ncbi:MAG: hypothetical protein MUF04_11915 [Akkermansiaceae bacterium]|nr:hypothetical protein [Akkermansiaceae bacterium]
MSASVILRTGALGPVDVPQTTRKSVPPFWRLLKSTSGNSKKPSTNRPEPTREVRVCSAEVV